jgi:putative ABC transport system permease protein
VSLADLGGFALGALRGHRLRSLLSLAGVAIGVAAVIGLTALGEGARRYVIEQFASLGTSLLAIVPGKTETTGFFPGAGGIAHDLTLADAEAVARALPGARSVAPMVLATETVRAADRSRQVPVIGSTHEFLDARSLEVARGAFLPPGELRRGGAVAVLGSTLARELFPGTDAVGRVVRIGSLRARVVGVLAPIGTQLGLDMNDIVVIPVATAMRIFDRRSLARLLIRLHVHSELPAARDRVLALLAARHGEEDVTAITQDAVMGAFSNILRALTLGLAAIAAISLAVAGIGIMNVMLVSVAERASEVGLLRALGVSRRQILGVFLTEAAILSTTGGLLGLGIGWLAIRMLVGLYPAVPASAPVWAVLASVGLAAAVGIGFGLAPARRAARLDPVAALARRA